MPAWQAVYFGMAIELDEKIVLGLCKVSLTPEYLAVVYWASAGTLTLSLGMQLLQAVSFLECRYAEMTSAKYGKLSGSPENQHHQAGQGKVGSVLFTKTLPEQSSCVTPHKSVVRTSKGFLFCSLLLQTEFRGLSLAVPCQIAVCFYPKSCCTQRFTACPLRGPGGQEA